MRYLWLVLAMAVAVIGVLVGRVLSLSPPTTAALSGIATFLALFPFMKRWMPKANFSLWALAVVIGAAVAWLLYLGFSRFGG